jgi:acetyl-CoA acyltransferase
MSDAVIVDVVRTAGGKRNGSLSGWHPADLAGDLMATLVERNDLDPATIDDVMLGCVSQVGAQALNIARNAALAAGFPESVPGTTIDRQCGSSQQAAAFAAQSIMAGINDIVIAAGVEVMSLVPMGASFGKGVGFPFGPNVEARYADAGGLIPQGLSAELIAEQWNISREELDAYSVESQMRAARARDEGRFDHEIVPVELRRRDKESGEVIRDTTTLESLAGLKPAFSAEGRVTAGNSSQITDGASAALIMSETMAAKLGLTPRARFHSFSLAGVDPRLMLTGPIPATHKVLERAGLSLDDIDLIEINEAFASVVLAWERELHPDMSKVNVNGGAIALGHPLGASGTKLLGTLLCELERTRGRYGLQTMCEGGGLANATIIERLG